MKTRAGHRTRYGALLVAGAFALGCGTVADKSDAGTGGDDSSITGDFSLAVVPTTLSVPIASSGTVTLHVERTGTLGDIMLSAPNLPAGITASFATNPLPEGTDSTEVTFEVAGGTMPLTTDVTIRGTAGSLTQQTTLQLSATTITVTGKIRGGTPNVTVRIVGKQSVLSDAAGNFTFTDVIPPYDLYVVGTTGRVFLGGQGIPAIAYYDDLTRTDPVITQPQATVLQAAVANNAQLTGVMTGMGSSNNQFLIQWSNGGTPTTSVASNGRFSHTAMWFSTATTNNGTLYGLEFTRRPNGFPNTFVGFGSTNTIVSSGNEATVNLSMAATGSFEVTGTITGPSGYPTPTLTLAQQFGNTSATLHQTTGTTVETTVPIINAGKAAIHATTSAGGATSSYVHPVAGAADVSIAMPAPAVQTAPIDAASGVDHSTMFTFSSAPSVVNEIELLTTATNGDARAAYFIYTTNTSITIPAVTELPLPRNQSMTWRVNGYGPASDINDAAAEQPLTSFTGPEFTGPKRVYTSSTIRELTTAP